MNICESLMDLLNLLLLLLEREIDLQLRQRSQLQTFFFVMYRFCFTPIANLSELYSETRTSIAFAC